MESHDFIVLNDGKWRISYRGERHGPYTTKSIAMIAARSAALKAASVGYEAEVQVQGDDGVRRTEWAYRDDPIAPDAGPSKPPGLHAS